jgi:hypothetical protein
MAGRAPGRHEGIIFPILLPIVVTAIVVACISGLGLVLLGFAAVDKSHAIIAALVVTVVIMVLCSFVYVLGERKQQEQI